MGADKEALFKSVFGEPDGRNWRDWGDKVGILRRDYERANEAVLD